MPIAGLTRKFLTANLQRRLRLDTVAPFITTDFSEAIQGPQDSVVLPTPNTITTNDYTVSIKTTVEEDPGYSTPTLTMDHQRSFSFVIPGNSNAMQYIQEHADSAFEDLLKENDEYVFAEADPASTGNMTAGDINFTVGTDDPKELAKSVEVNLGESGVRMNAANRFMVVTPALAGELGDFVEETGFNRADEVNEFGFMGVIRGTRVFRAESTQFVNVTGARACFYGIQSKLAFAQAVASMNVVDQNALLEYPGGTGVNGLHIAGVKVIDNAAFGRIIVD